MEPFEPLGGSYSKSNAKLDLAWRLHKYQDLTRSLCLENIYISRPHSLLMLLQRYHPRPTIKTNRIMNRIIYRKSDKLSFPPHFYRGPNACFKYPFLYDMCTYFSIRGPTYPVRAVDCFQPLSVKNYCKKKTTKKTTSPQPNPKLTLTPHILINSPLSSHKS